MKLRRNQRTFVALTTDTSLCDAGCGIPKSAHNASGCDIHGIGCGAPYGVDVDPEVMSAAKWEPWAGESR